MSYSSTNGTFAYTITNNTDYVIEQLDYDIILSAFNRWDNLITIDSRFGASYIITISFNIDALGIGILGGASITSSSYIDTQTFGNVVPYTADITMNNLYLQGLKTTIRNDGYSSYYYVLLHEIGHILGIGSFWYLTGCPKTSYDDNGTTKHYYTGTSAVREYKLHFGNNTFVGVPIEDNGGAGTAGVHPEEGPEGGISADNRYINGILHPGLDTELMTGWLDSSPVSTPLSRITLGFLEDMGYTVNYNLADVYIMAWLATTDANNLEQTYIQGFLDVSGGNMINRNGNLSILQGTMDVSGGVAFNSTLSVGGDVSLCYTTGTRVDICGNLYAQYPNNSIPSTAIDGLGDVTPNFTGNVDFQAGVTIATKAAIGSTTLPTGNTALHVTGDVDFTGLLKRGGVEYVSGATSLAGLSDVIVGGVGFASGLLIGTSNPGTLFNNAIGNTGVGATALMSLTSGDSNCAFGRNALNATTTASENSAFGYNALSANNASFNNAFGSNALNKTNSGVFNNAFGSNALTANTTGNYNIAFGYSALLANIGSAYNCAVGGYALNNTTGGYNSALGHNAGTTNTTGINNTYIGYWSDAALDLTGLNNSTAIGANAKVTASNQIMLGTAGERVVIPGPKLDVAGDIDFTGSLLNNGTAFVSGATDLDGLSDVIVGGTNFTNSLLIGHSTTGSLSDATMNVGVGSGVFNALTTGDNNNAMGYQALYNNTTGSENCAIGRRALYSNITGTENCAYGNRTLDNNTGSYNNAMGQDALYNNTTGSGNCAVGVKTLYVNSTGVYNSAFGYNALVMNNTGGNNSAVGSSSLYNTTGGNNSAVGVNAGNVNTTGSNNTYIGYNANAATGLVGLSNSTAIGYNAKVTASNQIMLGTADETVKIPGSKLDVAGDIDFTGSLLNNGVEYASGATDLSGLSDVIVGGAQFTDSLLIGHSTTGVLNAATNNVGVGSGVFNALTSGARNTATGYRSLAAVTTGHSNTGYGYQTLAAHTSGMHNTAFGTDTLVKQTSGDFNTAIGSHVLNNNLTGIYNTGVGGNAMYNATGSYNTGVGLQSLYTATGDYNTSIGNDAGRYNNAGTNNTWIGYNTNPSVITDSHNYCTIIGYNAVATGDNQIVLGTASETVKIPGNLLSDKHITINPIDVAVDVKGIQALDESLKFTIPNSMTALKYFCTAHSSMIGDFILASSPTETDKTYYVRTTGTTDPFYIFSSTPNGTALNDTAAIGSGLQLTLYKGNTYTFISTNTVGHPFMVGDSHNVTTGIKLESTGNGATTASTYTNPYPLHVNGMANIENNLNVARSLTVSGTIRQW